MWLVGSGVAGGNVLPFLLVTLTADPGRPVPIVFIVRGVLFTSGVMLAVALLACASPAKRAPNPTDRSVATPLGPRAQASGPVM